MEKQSPEGRAHDIAMRIYIELVARNTEITQESVKLTASAANIANLSLKLSEAFLHAEAEAILAKEPVKGHTLHGDDIAKWSK
jgi:hypothetical protein